MMIRETSRLGLALALAIGAILPVGSWAQDSQDGVGWVFMPDPLTSAGVPYGDAYVNNQDADSPELTAQLKTVTLPELDYGGGRYLLQGPNVVLTDVDAPDQCIGEHETYPIVRPDNKFFYTRSAQEFEGVMVYYYVDQSARYLKSLGYWDRDGDPTKGLDRLKVDPHGNTCTNTFNQYINTILLKEVLPIWGDKVDGGEDACIILHEYGHAIEHHIGPGLVPEGGTGESGAVWEGGATYWAISYKRSLSDYEWAAFTPWFYMGDATMISRADFGYPYPYEKKEKYKSGQIWTSALMDIWGKIGKEMTDRLYLLTIANLPSVTNLPQAAMTLIDAEYYLESGGHRKEILESLDGYGLVYHVSSIPYSAAGSNYVYRGDLNPPVTYERFNSFDVPGADGADTPYFLHLDQAARLNITVVGGNGFSPKVEIYDLARVSTGLYSESGVLSNIRLPAGQYFIVVDSDGGALGDYQITIDYATPPVSVQVYALEEQLSNPKLAVPRVYFRNTGATALSNFRVRYYFTTEGTAKPVVEDYWTPLSNMWLEQMSPNQWCLVLDYTGSTLLPNGRIPDNSGEVFGLHYADWSPWDKSNDFSQSSSNQFTLTDRIAVFDSTDTLVYGKMP